jgi:hypothetical protein
MQANYLSKKAPLLQKRALTLLEKGLGDEDLTRETSSYSSQSVGSEAVPTWRKNTSTTAGSNFTPAICWM